MEIKPRPLDDPRNAEVALRKELIALGMNDAAIAALVRAGVLVRVRMGAYVDAPTYRGLDQAGRYGVFTRAIVRQAKTDVVVSHVSALPEYDAPLWGQDLSHGHLTRRDGKSGRKAAGVHQHCGLIEPGDVVVLNGLEVMSATRVALEVTTVASTEASLVVVNDLLHRRLTTVQEIERRYQSIDAWPGTLHTDLVLRLADGRLESVGETRTFYLFWHQHVPFPETQYELRDSSGSVVARVDFAWPEHRVYLEFDGFEKYVRYLLPGETIAEAVMREKKREERIHELTGWRCIRISWADLAHPERTAARIMALLFPENRKH